MSVVSSRLVKQYAFKFCAIASTALGIVSGLAVFGKSLPLSDYAKFWLLMTVCLWAVFVLGLISDNLLSRVITAPIFPKFGSAIKKVRFSIQRRLKQDRTDEEYRRIENGMFVPIVLIILVAMLFLVGEWTAQAFIILLFLWLAKSVFIAFNASTRHGVGGLIGWTFSGFFLALLFGFFS